MLTEQEKKLLQTADALAKNQAESGLEAYLTDAARHQAREHPSRAAWAIHFHDELCRAHDKPTTELNLEFLGRAYRLADAAVAYDLLGERAFNYASFLEGQKLKQEFLQIVQRYRGRMMDPSVKTILLRMAREICDNANAGNRAA